MRIGAAVLREEAPHQVHVRARRGGVEERAVAADFVAAQATLAAVQGARTLAAAVQFCRTGQMYLNEYLHETEPTEVNDTHSYY